MVTEVTQLNGRLSCQSTRTVNVSHSFISFHAGFHLATKLLALWTMDKALQAYL